jgi:transcriptional regulator with XRE-family HTH domain
MIILFAAPFVVQSSNCSAIFRTVCADGRCLRSASNLRYSRAISNQRYCLEQVRMTFGERVRELRHAKGWSLRDLAKQVEVGFTYLSRVENGRLNYGDYPSDGLIHRLADALDADEEELLVLAERIPERIRQRFLERPDVFSKLAELDDKALDQLVAKVDAGPSKAAKKVK